MNKLALLLTAPLWLAVSNPAVAATEVKTRAQSNFTLDGSLLQLSDRQLPQQLKGAAVHYQFQYAPKVQFELAFKAAEADQDGQSQQYRRYHLDSSYQLLSFPAAFKCECTAGLMLRVGHEKYQGVVNDSHALYGAGFYSRGTLLPGFYSETKFGYQDDTAEGALSRRGWFLDYQLSYEINHRADIYLNYQRQYDQHSTGLGISIRFF
jgi:hypothetical protein